MSHDDDEFLGADDIEQLAYETQGMDPMSLAETVRAMDPTSDELQAFANLRGVQRSQLGQQAPFQSLNPASALNNPLGNQATLTIPANGGLPAPWGNFGTAAVNVIAQPIQVANWIGKDIETRAVTVSLAAVQKLTQQVVVGPLRPYALIQFGTYGSLSELEVDVGLGTQFTLNASQVNVRLGLETETNFTVIGGFPFYAEATLNGMLSFGTTTHNLDVTRTRYLAAPPAGNGLRTVPIPPFAKNVRIVSQNATDAYTLTFRSAAGSQDTYIVTVAAGITPANLLPIPISGGVQFVDVLRTDGSGNTVFASLIFGLAL